MKTPNNSVDHGLEANWLQSDMPFKYFSYSKSETLMITVKSAWWSNVLIERGLGDPPII
jgi:hypothetical protein